MNDLSLEILSHIFSYSTRVSDRVALKLCCKEYNNIIVVVSKEDCIFAEICCLENNYSMFLFAVEGWKQPLLKQYYKAATIGKSLEIIKYLHVNNITTPLDTVYNAAKSTEEIYKYCSKNFIYCDTTLVGTVPRPWITTSIISDNDNIIHEAARNNNLEYLKLLHENGILISRFTSDSLFKKYRDDRSLKETVLWLISQGYRYNIYMIDDPEIDTTNFDLVDALISGATSLISFMYKINVTRDTPLSEIIRLLPDDAHVKCNRVYDSVCHTEWQILLYCEKHGIAINNLNHRYAPYHNDEITEEGLECLNRLFPEIYTNKWKTEVCNFLRINFSLTKNWLLKTFSNHYHNDFFFVAAINMGEVHELVKDDRYTFSDLFEKSNHRQVWDFLYDNYNKEPCISTNLKQIAWLKDKGLLDIENTTNRLHLTLNCDEIEITKWILK